MDLEDEILLKGQIWLLVCENLPGKTPICEASGLVEQILEVFYGHENQLQPNQEVGE